MLDVFQPDFVYHRRLPHWRKRGACYFVTWRIAADQPGLADPERAEVFHSLKHFHQQHYLLWAGVVMNDHVHALFTSADETRWPVMRIVGDWKGYTSKRIRTVTGSRPRAVWQRDYFNRIIRTKAEFHEKVHYTTNNPWKRWPELESYAWVTPQPSVPYDIPRPKRPHDL